MKGAVAAGHPLTAAAGARVLEEGGNAVDACVAAAFAAWVAESPLTGPGRGRLRPRRPGGRAAGAGRRLLRRDARARPCRRRPDAEMHAIDVGFGGDSETTQVFRIGEASCAVPGAAAGLEAVHRAYGRLPWPELLAAGDRAGARRRRADAAAGAPARDPRPDPAAHRRGPPRSTAGADGARLGPGDLLRLPDLGGTLERIAARGRRRALPRRARARRSSRPSATAAAALTARRPGGLPRRLAPPVRVALPRARGRSRTRRRRPAAS